MLIALRRFVTNYYSNAHCLQLIKFLNKKEIIEKHKTYKFYPLLLFVLIKFSFDLEARNNSPAYYTK